VAGEMLRIFMLERLGEIFNQTSVPLRYTPRKLVMNPTHRTVIVIETDHNAYSEEELKQINLELAKVGEMGDDEPIKVEADDDEMGGTAAMAAGGSAAASSSSSSSSSAAAAADAEMDPETAALKAAEDAFMGPLQGGVGKWASCVRIVDPTAMATVGLIELADNEAAFSVALVSFTSHGDELFLAVGTAKDVLLSPRAHSAAFIHIYRFGADGRTLTLEHKTAVDHIPLTLTPFHGQLLAGVGKVVRLYDMGKKKLLRKSELKSFPSCVQSLHTMGDRIFGGDMTDAFQFIKYRRSDKGLYVFAENTSPRFLTATCVVDYDTMAGGDKFGNILVSRLPEDAAEDVEDTSAASVTSTVFNSNTNKLVDLCNFYVGEAITSMCKTTLVPGGSEILLYSTIFGTIGALVPFTSRDVRETFQSWSSLRVNIRVRASVFASVCEKARARARERERERERVHLLM
jgi:splicing factor 3B subunit 3